MQDDAVRVICENSGTEMYVNWGMRLKDVAAMLPKPRYPYLAAYVNNEVRELGWRVSEPVNIRFIDATDYEGLRVYRRTFYLILQKAVHDLYPEAVLCIKYAISEGVYATVDGIGSLTPQMVSAISDRVTELVECDIPIVKDRRPTAEVESMYREFGFDDKVELLRTRPHLYSVVYTLAGLPGFFYGPLAPSTSLIRTFALALYRDGLYISLPDRDDPETLLPRTEHDRLFATLEEYKNSARVMDVSTIGKLNRKILDGQTSDLIRTSEAFQENKLAMIASMIDSRVKDGVRMVLISGPSSSGKTTFANRLGVQLMILGYRPVLMSLDDYFVDRDLTPRDENGEYDFEVIEALDLPRLNSHLSTLISGGSVCMPCFDFIAGTHSDNATPVSLDGRSILLVEGIHGLNPKLTAEIDDKYKFRIFISALTSLSMDNLSRISTTDTRLLRRIVRDHRTRGCDATATLKRWPSVRRGEELNIFPYQENADVMFNSALFYELAALKPFLKELLLSVPDTEAVYGESRRLLHFLSHFQGMESKEVPPVSILREFIGGGSFHV